ncbi:MAG: hypothetical protein FWG56_06110 [Desulfovibrionaceae bacterium]|jgi:hypothetical protein|nr:hypothetical protein [Desulfovibrionaceae bacterium]
MKFPVILAAALLAAAGAQAACYTVMGPKGETLSQSPNPPVDMAHPLHETVPFMYGGGSVMVFGIADSDCGNEADTYYEAKASPSVLAASKDQAPARTKRKARRNRK